MVALNSLASLRSAIAKRTRFVISPETLEKINVEPLNPTAFIPDTQKKGAFYFDLHQPEAFISIFCFLFGESMI